MNTTEILKTRIQEAGSKKKSSFNPNLGYEKIASLLNPKLEALSQEKPFRKQIWVDEVFGGRKRQYKRDFVFQVLKTEHEIEALRQNLEQNAHPNEEWDLRNWLLSAHKSSSTILTVKRDRDREFAGFATLDISVELENHADEDETPDPTLFLNVWLDTVYIQPTKRGYGFSEALSFTIADHVDDIARAVVEWNDPHRKYLEKYPFEIGVSGEAHSAGGARYITRTLENIKSRLDFFEVESTWEVIPELTNFSDCSDFTNGGFSRR